MPVTDPRERFDDLHVERSEHEVGAARFAELEAEEAFVSGWVTTAVVLDDEDRVLLAYDADDEHWLIPGGTLQTGESLEESVVRELHEETGVPVVPERPHALTEVAAVCDDDELIFRVVTFEASPETTVVGANLGVDDESITDADWFDELPEEMFSRDHVAVMLDKIRKA